MPDNETSLKQHVCQLCIQLYKPHTYRGAYCSSYDAPGRRLATIEMRRCGGRELGPWPAFNAANGVVDVKLSHNSNYSRVPPRPRSISDFDGELECRRSLSRYCVTGIWAVSHTWLRREGDPVGTPSVLPNVKILAPSEGAANVDLVNALSR
jgi:hypothetical protein